MPKGVFGATPAEFWWTELVCPLPSRVCELRPLSALPCAIRVCLPSTPLICPENRSFFCLVLPSLSGVFAWLSRRLEICCGRMLMVGQTQESRVASSSHLEYESYPNFLKTDRRLRTLFAVILLVAFPCIVCNPKTSFSESTRPRPFVLDG